MMLKEESKKQLITRATQYGVDPRCDAVACPRSPILLQDDLRGDDDS